MIMNKTKLAGEILADAFLHYPLMKYAFEGQNEIARSKNLLHLYSNCANACAKYGKVITTENNKGALIWLPGSNFPLGLYREIKSGMATIPLKIGVKSTLRLMNHDSVPESWIKKNAGGKMGYIWCLGIVENERGKGLSRHLVEESIAQMKAEGINEYWLKTEDPKNVIIYQKFGFEIMHKTIVKSSGIKSWVFRKI